MLWRFGLGILPYLSEHILFRFVLVALTAFLGSLAVGNWMIRRFREKRWFEDTTQPDHAELNAIQSRKKNVPTMGGLMIIAGILVSLLLWADPLNGYVLIGVLCMTLLGALGFVDDYIKLRRSASRGLNKKTKLLLQIGIGLIVGYLFTVYMFNQSNGTRLCDPVTGLRTGDLGVFYLAWVTFVLVASCNAVNLTDGLDGLAGGCTAIAAATFFALGLLATTELGLRHVFLMPKVAGGEEICVLSASVLGSVLGFLWYNSHPAQIFMGDTGSLALGGLLGFIGLALKLDSLLFLICAVFFVDELTVALQIVSYKLTRRRIFPITPIHHYFQIGLHWPEQKVTARFWILAALAGFVSAMLLRARVSP